MKRTYNYSPMGNDTWLSKRSGLHSSNTQGPYRQFSSALGRDYAVNEYVPYYHNSYVTSSAAGRAQREADKAAAENTARYYEILEGYKGLLDSGQDAVTSAYDKALSSDLQAMTDRGLTGTTVMNNVRSRNTVSRELAKKRLYDRNLMSMLQFMERRNTGTGQLA